MKLFAAMLVVAVLAGCRSDIPAPTRLGLQLPPAALGASLSLQQQLAVEREGRTDYLEAAVEIDPDRITLVGLALGQRVLSLDYDGQRLTTWHHPMLPRQVRGEDVLEDLQLTYWPLESVRAALPAGWRVEDSGMRRTLWAGDAQVLTIDYDTSPAWMGKVTLDNLRYRYRLTIHSALNQP